MNNTVFATSILNIWKLHLLPRNSSYASCTPHLFFFLIQLMLFILFHISISATMSIMLNVSDSEAGGHE